MEISSIDSFKLNINVSISCIVILHRLYFPLLFEIRIKIQQPGLTKMTAEEHFCASVRRFTSFFLLDHFHACAVQLVLCLRTHNKVGKKETSLSLCVCWFSLRLKISFLIFKFKVIIVSLPYDL